ncbi:MAG: sel1 repeat family protein [Gammaproteobacteria bacterium]|nr:sel1 repeat family protein [Gammaproteobacteria bacterium]MCP4983410.1 sel1 repeat family protein [Gammaproteobacteria bacterium]
MVTYAEERSCTTQFELGELFNRGEQRSRDYEQAFRWYEKAAKNGSRQAQHKLGTLYARGQGVSQNFAEAYAWFKVAAFQKSDRGKRKMKCLEAKMCLDQIRQGRWLAQDYYDLFVKNRIETR